MLRDIEAEKALFQKLGMFKDPELLEKYVIASDELWRPVFLPRVRVRARRPLALPRATTRFGRASAAYANSPISPNSLKVIYKSLVPALLALLHGLHARHILLQVAVRICVLITCDSKESARFASFSLSAFRLFSSSSSFACSCSSPS